MNTSKEHAAKEIAKILLNCEAVKLRPEQPFKWSSGWNSPIYCDNRLTLSFPQERYIIKKYLADAVRSNFRDAGAIAGVATAGIPQGALLADELSLPFLYVRPKPKEHGMANLIEGKITKGQKVVVVEDLISTGGSSLKAVDSLKENGFDVIGMVAIFSYGFELAENNFKNAGVNLVCLSDYTTLIQEALNLGLIKNDDLVSLSDWRKSPENWK